MEKFTLFWFRRDLRLEDNHGLFKALSGGNKVIPIFIFDTEILNKLPQSDARVEYILIALGAIDRAMDFVFCRYRDWHVNGQRPWGCVEQQRETDDRDGHQNGGTHQSILRLTTNRLDAFIALGPTFFTRLEHREEPQRTFVQ